MDDTWIRMDRFPIEELYQVIFPLYPRQNKLVSSRLDEHLWMHAWMGSAEMGDSTDSTGFPEDEAPDCDQRTPHCGEPCKYGIRNKDGKNFTRGWSVVSSVVFEKYNDMVKGMLTT